MALVTLDITAPDVGSISTSVQDDQKIRRRRMQRRQSFVMVKGAALLLQDGEEPIETTELTPSSGPSEQQIHLQAMLRLLREKDTLKLAVRLEPLRLCLTRYLLVISSTKQTAEEQTILLGVDFPHDGSLGCTIGIVLPIWSNTQVFLDGDGGFSVTSGMDVRSFKPISVQTMWSLLQMLHKACECALNNNFISGSGLHAGLTYYQSHRSSPQGCVNAWKTTSDLTSVCRDPSTPEREETERIIRIKLQDILRESDLENITSKEVRNALEQHTNCALKDYKEFIDNEMILILAQMDRPSEIFPYLFLGTEWNASNLEELQKNKVSHILNVTREIDNFFPEMFTYLNIRVLDEENTDLMQYWMETHGFISSARQQGTNVLVHCKMGVSRSASTVIAYAMKEYEWTLETAISHVKERRSIIQPNAGFLRQLQTYQGILGASKQRHSYLWEPAPPLSKVLSPPINVSNHTNLAITPRLKKINLRTLMRSISEMEVNDTISEQKQSTGLEKNILKDKYNMPEHCKNANDHLESITERKENFCKDNITILEEKNPNRKEDDLQYKETYNKTEYEKQVITETNESTDELSFTMTEKSLSLDEVFFHTPHMSISTLQKTTPEQIHCDQQNTDVSQCCTAENSQSKQEKDLLVSTKLQKDDHLMRKARITRQQNVGDPLGEP